jgi:hypothetical protein
MKKIPAAIRNTQDKRLIKNFIMTFVINNLLYLRLEFIISNGPADSMPGMAGVRDIVDFNLVYLEINVQYFDQIASMRPIYFPFRYYHTILLNKRVFIFHYYK